MPSDAYMELSDPSVWGETYDAQFGMQGRALGAFEISKFDFDISAKDDEKKKQGTATQPTSGGGGATPTTPQAKHEEATIDSFKIVKYIDKSSPDLFLACLKKSKINWAIVSIRESGEEPRKPYLVVEFQNLEVQSFNWALSPGDPEASDSVETVEFKFEKVVIKYSRQDLSGAHRVVKIKGWDREKNVPFQEEVDTSLIQGEVQQTY